MWCGLADAHSTELAPATAHPVIALMPDQVGRDRQGRHHAPGQLSLPSDRRVARRPSALRRNWRSHERHRHRYEFNNDYRQALTGCGPGRCPACLPDGSLVEMVELPDHPWFVGGQFHPEFKSRPNKAHPLFRGFVGAAKAYKNRHE